MANCIKAWKYSCSECSVLRECFAREATTGENLCIGRCDNKEQLIEDGRQAFEDMLSLLSLKRKES